MQAWDIIQLSRKPVQCLPTLSIKKCWDDLPAALSLPCAPEPSSGARWLVPRALLMPPSPAPSLAMPGAPGSPPQGAQPSGNRGSEGGASLPSLSGLSRAVGLRQLHVPPPWPLAVNGLLLAPCSAGGDPGAVQCLALPCCQLHHLMILPATSSCSAWSLSGALPLGSGLGLCLRH